MSIPASFNCFTTCSFMITATWSAGLFLRVLDWILKFTFFSSGVTYSTLNDPNALGDFFEKTSWIFMTISSTISTSAVSGVGLSSSTGFFFSGLFSAGFVSSGFLSAGFFSASFLSAGFFSSGFFSTGFSSSGFFSSGFLSAGFFSSGFFSTGFFSSGFFSSGFFSSGFSSPGAFSPRIYVMSIPASFNCFTTCSFMITATWSAGLFLRVLDWILKFTFFSSGVTYSTLNDPNALGDFFEKTSWIFMTISSTISTPEVPGVCLSSSAGFFSSGFFAVGFFSSGFFSSGFFSVGFTSSGFISSGCFSPNM